jgi:N-acetylglucosamine-6-phosphate deacetylase
MKDMKKYLICGATVVNCDSLLKADILVEDGRITAVGGDFETTDAKKIDANGSFIFPGFIDIHIHGAEGVDVNEADAEGFHKIGEFLARNGVTSWLPTLVPDTDESYTRTVAELNRSISLSPKSLSARILGLHYEGVFANEAMCGALRPQYFKKFSSDVLSTLPRLDGALHLTTYAPEISGGLELTKELVKNGWIASIGHTKADVETLEKAFSLGARHLTHFFNAMTGLHHREMGVAGWGLTKSDVTFDIIADGIHVRPEILKFAIDTKGAEKVVLISDSIAPTGLGDGPYSIWGETISVNGLRTKNERGGIAGSVITIADAVRMLHRLGFDLTSIAAMSSANAARLLRLENRLGRIAPGFTADLVIMDQDLNIINVMLRGQLLSDK